MVLKYRNDPNKLKQKIKEVIEIFIKNDKVNNDVDISSTCNKCKIVVQRAIYAQCFWSKKHFENEKQFQMIIHDWLFQDLIEIKAEKKI